MIELFFEPAEWKRVFVHQGESGWRRFTKSLAGDWGQSPLRSNEYYLGERESACVFTLRRCLSTTRRNSRSIVLNASCTTFASGLCVPLSICFSSATSSWPGGTVTSIRTRYWFPFLWAWFGCSIATSHRLM